MQKHDKMVALAKKKCGNDGNSNNSYWKQCIEKYKNFSC